MSGEPQNWPGEAGASDSANGGGERSAHVRSAGQSTVNSA